MLNFAIFCLYSDPSVRGATPSPSPKHGLRARCVRHSPDVVCSPTVSEYSYNNVEVVLR